MRELKVPASVQSLGVLFLKPSRMTVPEPLMFTCLPKSALFQLSSLMNSSLHLNSIMLL